MQHYVTGTPSLEESCDCWKADLRERDVQDGEYHAAYESLCKHIESRFSRGESPPDLYVRGDCFGDKTQYIHFRRPEIMDMNLILFLQQWLKRYGKHDWRILLATELGDAEAVLLYPNVIRVGKEYERELATSLKLFIQRMRERDENSGDPCLKPRAANG